MTGRTASSGRDLVIVVKQCALRNNSFPALCQCLPAIHWKFICGNTDDKLEWPLWNLCGHYFTTCAKQLGRVLSNSRRPSNYLSLLTFKCRLFFSSSAHLCWSHYYGNSVHSWHRPSFWCGMESLLRFGFQLNPLDLVWPFMVLVKIVPHPYFYEHLQISETRYHQKREKGCVLL